MIILRRKADKPTPKHKWKLTHLASFLSRSEDIFELGIEPPIFFLRFGYLSTIIR